MKTFAFWSKISLASIMLMAVSACGSSENKFEVAEYEGSGLNTVTSDLNSASLKAAKIEVIDLQPIDNRKVDGSDDWKVCTQSVKPGATIDRDSTVTLGVVDRNEVCPQKGVVAEPKVKAQDEANLPDPPSSGVGFPEIKSNIPVEAAVSEIKKSVPEGTVMMYKDINDLSGDPSANLSKFKYCFSAVATGEKLGETRGGPLPVFIIAQTDSCPSRKAFFANLSQ